MNDLLSRSFSGGRTGDIEIGNTVTTGANLENFFHDVEAIKTELKALESLHNQLRSSNEQIKTLHNANAIKTLKTKMDNDVMETVLEIQERNDAVTMIERNLKELHQVFMDMAVLVEHPGEQLDDIESVVNRANSFVTSGTRQLNEARKKQKNTRKWTCFGILLLLIIIVIIVLSIRPWK